MSAEQIISLIVHICLGLSVISVLGYFIWINLRGKKQRELPVQTDRATVYYKHPEPEYFATGAARYTTAGNYIYHITFHTDGGLALKLYLNFDRYAEIQENSAGQLTWQGNRFWNFVPEENKEN